MSPAWVAVGVSAVTVLANIFGVMWASRTQRRLAHIERIGDRRIETYLDLLRWLDSAREELRQERGAFGAFEAVKLPEDLKLRTFAFTSDKVLGLTAEFQAAWIKAHDAVAQNKEPLIERMRTGLAQLREQLT